MYLKLMHAVSIIQYLMAGQFQNTFGFTLYSISKNLSISPYVCIKWHLLLLYDFM